MEGHTDDVSSVVYSQDGAYIVSGSNDDTIRVWDAHLCQRAGQPLVVHNSGVTSVAYSPDGAYIISGSSDFTIRIWDVYTGQPASRLLERHAGAANSVVYSPDGAYIVSSSSDKTVHIWSTKLALQMSDILEIDIRQSQLVKTLPAISEPRILCNLGCQVNCPHIAWTLDEYGWIFFDDDRRLIWVPPDLRDVILFPRNTALMSSRGFLVQLDLDQNKNGEHWHEYFQPGGLSNHD